MIRLWVVLWQPLLFRCSLFTGRLVSVPKRLSWKAIAGHRRGCFKANWKLVASFWWRWVSV